MKISFYIYCSVIYIGLFCTPCPIGQRPVLGIESITKKVVEKHAQLCNPRVGLVTNQTGVTENGLLSVAVLQKKGVQVKKLFAPEHGYWGTVPAGLPVETVIDPVTNISVVSLYAHGQGKTVTREQFKDIDVLIFDMQDCGMRHFTYISTLYKVMEACGAFNVPLIVTDRPNPLGGLMEGPLVDVRFQSFISIASVPLRHGMTFGELALYFNKQFFKSSVHLKVVRMKKYKRALQDFIFLNKLSPNLPTVNAVYGYSFLGLAGEIAPFDVGVGTAYAFQQIGLPLSFARASYVCQDIAEAFVRYGIGTKIITYKDKKQRTCMGVRLFFNQDCSWSSIKCLKAIVSAAKKEKIPLVFSQAFPKAFGTDALQKNVGAFDMSSITNELNSFYVKAQSCFLYMPKPTLWKQYTKH